MFVGYQQFVSVLQDGAVVEVVLLACWEFLLERFLPLAGQLLEQL